MPGARYCPCIVHAVHALAAPLGVDAPRRGACTCVSSSVCEYPALNLSFACRFHPAATMLFPQLDQFKFLYKWYVLVILTLGYLLAELGHFLIGEWSFPTS